MTLEEEGIIKLWDCELYCGSKKRYKTAREFVDEAIQNVDGEGQEINAEQILAIVRTNWMIHRCNPCQWHEGETDWWEHVDDAPGPGRVPVWAFDLEEVEA